MTTDELQNEFEKNLPTWSSAYLLQCETSENINDEARELVRAELRRRGFAVGSAEALRQPEFKAAHRARRIQKAKAWIPTILFLSVLAIGCVVAYRTFWMR